VDNQKQGYPLKFTKDTSEQRQTDKEAWLSVQHDTNHRTQHGNDTTYKIKTNYERLHV